MSIHEEAAKGRREGLMAVRDKLARDMDDAPPAVVAQVAAQLRAVLKELDELRVPEEKPKVDQLAERRANRRAKTASAASASAGGVVGGV